MSQPELRPEEDKTSSHQAPKADSRRGISVFIYLAILFAAAFLMLLLAYFIQQRNNDATIDSLRDSITSIASRDELLAENKVLQDQLNELEKALETAQSDAARWQEEYEALSPAVQQGTVWQRLWQLEYYYQAENYPTCASLLRQLAQTGDLAGIDDPTVLPRLQALGSELVEGGWLERDWADGFT